MRTEQFFRRIERRAAPVADRIHDLTLSYRHRERNPDEADSAWSEGRLSDGSVALLGIFIDRLRQLQLNQREARPGVLVPVEREDVLVVPRSSAKRD